MITSYTRLYYGERGTALGRDAAPPRLVAAAESLIPMLHPERSHTYAATEPNLGKLHTMPINGSIGWIVTFTPEHGG